MQARFSGGVLSAGWKSTPTTQKGSCNDKTKGFYHPSPFGTMYVPSTDTLGTELLMWFRADSLANPSATQPTEKQQPWTFSQKCFESLRKSTPDLCSLKMLSYHPLSAPQKTLNRSVIKPKSPLFQRQTWVQTTLGEDTGFLHTPTCTANYTAPSMMKHKCCQLFLQAFGKARNPLVAEWLMGWIIGWTDCTPLGMDKYQQWQQRHGQS